MLSKLYNSLIVRNSVMNVVYYVFCGLLFFASAVTTPRAHAENTRVTYPNALSIEALGKGLLYALQYDRVISEQMGIGLGLGHVKTRLVPGANADVATSLLSAHFRFYFSQEAGSLYLVGGPTLVANGDAVKNRFAAVSALEFSDTPLLALAGVGYEYRSDAQFLMRITGYAIAGKNIIPLAGITLGYAF